MSFIKPLALILLTEECFEKYFFEFDFFDGPCFKASLSKALGFAIIAGSVLVKLPQILKLYKNKSGAGLNMLGVAMELLAITINASYNFVNGFPFSAWGDGFMLAVQTAIIAYLVLHYNGQAQQGALFIVVYVAFCFMMASMVPLKVLWTLQGCNLPIILSGKLIQAKENYKNGNTGQLSAATVFMLTGGSTARIFTSVQETGDPMMIVTYGFATMANLVLAAQMIYYWNVDVSKQSSKKTN